MAALGWLINLGFAASPHGTVVVVNPEPTPARHGGAFANAKKLYRPWYALVSSILKAKIYDEDDIVLSKAHTIMYQVIPQVAPPLYHAPTIIGYTYERLPAIYCNATLTDDNDTLSIRVKSKMNKRKVKSVMEILSIMNQFDL